MIVELLTLGDELLDGRRLDTNAAWLGRRLTALGVPPRFRQTAADRTEEIAAAFRLAFSRADLVLATGGVGPTEDDVTFEALAAALGVGLQFRPDIFERIEGRFAARGLACPASNRRQAVLPEGAEALRNEWGTAPGCRAAAGRSVVFCLPGVPVEMEKLFERYVAPELEGRLPRGERRRERTYRFVGLSESHVKERIDRCGLGALPGAEVRLAYAAAFPQIEVTLSIRPDDPDRFPELCRTIDDRISAQFGDHWVAGEGETAEERVISALRSRGLRLAVAESATGGLVSAQLVNVPGSSDVLECGFVAYSNASKTALLGVSQDTLARHGAVSEECAREMAEGARRRSGANVAVSTTGIAGPGGALPGKPVGTTYIAWVGPGFEEVRRFEFRSDRNRNRMAAAAEALRGLLRLLGGPNP